MTDVRISLRQLEYFVAAAETGTIAAAAEHHHISATAVSSAVSQLEKTLDLQLVIRRKAKGLTLTQGGETLLAHARELLEHAGVVEADVRSLGTTLSGSLTVGCFSTLAPLLLPTLVDELPCHHPDLVLEVVEDSVTGLHQRLTDGSCEVAMMYDIGIEPGFDVTPLYTTAAHIVLPATHPLAEHGRIALGDLAAEPMALLDLPPIGDHFLRQLERRGTTPHVQYRCRSAEAIRALVARGRAWSILLQRPQVLHSYEGLPLAQLDITDTLDPVSVALVTTTGQRATRKARAFMDFCRRTGSAASGDPRSGAGQLRAPFTARTQREGIPV
ncbi:LysR family transcriptional regulator [Rhodococcus sp. NPDC019627]|uniref:LysR family transcriptional regulator n=1 Tax=unclassified Rhodococcus (in: high G+C Gram-positive bacteria) TaxID=192944 RepID=UPI0033CF3059